MKETTYLETTPCEEPCAQVGTDGYEAAALAECARWQALLETMFGPAPEGCAFRVNRTGHDYGERLELVLDYEDDNPRARTYALHIDSNMPAEWPTKESA